MLFSFFDEGVVFMKVDRLLAEKVGEITKQAGAIVMDYWGKSLILNQKKDAGFATQADIKSEAFIIEQLKQFDAGIPFWAEESGKSSDNSDWYWVIDPLDGTTNFAHHIPYFCVSVALAYKDEPQIGAIYNPLMDELFLAYKGGGAYLNGKKIQVSSCALQESIIATSLPYVATDGFVHIFKGMQQVRSHVAALRMMGAAALDLAYSANGHFNGVFFSNLKWWDVAAGILILQEAGALVTDFQGNPVDDHFQTFVAASSALHSDLLHLLKSPFG